MYDANLPTDFGFRDGERSPAKPQSTTETLEPCPLCDKPLTRLTNGLAYCHNFKKDFASIDDWKTGSCLMAQHNVQLPTHVWQALRARLSPASTAPVVDNEVHCWHCGIVLERTELKPRCDECSADCDDEFCNAFGCAPSAAATAAPGEQSGILMQAISFCNHLAEHVTQELTEQSDNPQRDILNYEDYRKGQIQAAVEIRDRLQQLVPNADEGTR